MTYQLEFSVCERIKEDEIGLQVPITLLVGAQEVELRGYPKT